MKLTKGTGLNRVLSILLCGLLMFGGLGMAPSSVNAQSGNYTAHTEHDGDCGFAPPVLGQSCTHEAAHPESGEAFTTTRDVYVTSAISELAGASRRGQVIQVSDENDLIAALEDAVDGDTIQITQDITLLGSLAFQLDDRNITITSSGGPYSLIRGSTFAGSLIYLIEESTQINGSLTLTNITLDGNSDNITLTAPSGIGGTPNTHYTLMEIRPGNTVTLGPGTILKNSNIGGYGAHPGAVYCAGILNISGGVIQNNNSNSGPGAIVLFGPSGKPPAVLNMTSGSIMNNGSSSNEFSSTAIEASSAEINITGGTITDNAGGFLSAWLTGYGASTVTISPQASSNITSTVYGTITGSDAPGGVAATVTLKSGASIVRDVQAEADGTFSMSGIPYGENYTAEISMEGYATQTTEPFTVMKDYKIERMLEPTVPANASLTVNGVSYVASGSTTGTVNTVPGASYDLATNTLTLSGYNSGAILAEMDLNLVLIGNNIVTGSESMGVVQAYSFDNSPKLTISGSGTLTVNNTKSTGTSYGIYGWTGVDIQNGTVAVNMTAAGYTYGIGTNRYPITIDVSQGASVTSTVAGGTNAAHAMVGSAVNITGSATIKEGDNEAGAQIVSSLTMTTIDVGEATKKYVSIAPAATPQALTASTFAELQTVLQNVQDGGTIQITASFNITGTLTLPNAKSISITSGTGGPYTLTRSGFTGEMLVVPYNSGLQVTNLVLDGNKSAVTAVGSILRTYGNTTLGGGAVLQNNNDTGYYGYGGGVEASEGSLTIDGAIIRNNHAEYGGGVYVKIGATLLLTSGEISGNTTEMSGGGIYIDGDTLGDATATMNGGTIKNNAAGSYGGGISNAGTLVVNGGSITGNTGSGSAIYTWTSSGGTTTVNTATITCAVRGKITGSDAPSGLAASVQLKQGGVPVGSPVTANADGTFVIPDVPRGIGYYIIVNIVGYTEGESNGFAIEYDDARNINVSLTPTGSPQVPTVTAVTVNPASIAVQKGQTQQFAATVTGTNNPAQTVSWSVSGGGAGTSIAASGLLTIAAGETASTLTVTATSTVDTSKSGIATVTVSNTPVIDYLLTVNSGSGSGNYPANTQVSIIAHTAPSGKVFDKWVSDIGGTFANANSATTTFTMPAGNVTVTATYKDSGGGPSYTNAFVFPKAADFDLNGDGDNHAPVAVTLSRGSYMLRAVTYNGAALIEGTDYTVSGTRYTFTEDFLSGLAVGEHKITFDMSGGADPVLTITVTDSTPEKWDNPFTDVFENDWFYDDVMYVYENGVMIGTSDTMFSPNAPVSRGMVVTTLWRMEGEPDAAGANPFTDLTQDWYTDAAIWAAEHKIVEGYGGGLFGPEDNITREDLAVMLYRYAKWKNIDVSASADLSGYTDTDEISGYALDAMKWAVAVGLIEGRSTTTLVPSGTATRAELATILHRFLEGIA